MAQIAVARDGESRPDVAFVSDSVMQVGGISSATWQGMFCQAMVNMLTHYIGRESQTIPTRIDVLPMEHAGGYRSIALIPRFE